MTLDLPDDTLDVNFAHPARMKRAQLMARQNAIDAGMIDPVTDAASIIGTHARFNLLFGATDKPQTIASPLSTHWVEVLDKIGYASVAEYVANGNIASTFALTHSIPLLAFSLWWEKCPTTLKNAAHRSSADVSMLQAELTLSAIPPDDATASLAKELSKVLADRAKAHNPELWIPTKVNKKAQTNPVVINIGANVPGLEHVGGAAPTTIEHHRPPDYGGAPMGSVFSTGPYKGNGVVIDADKVLRRVI